MTKRRAKPKDGYQPSTLGVINLKLDAILERLAALERQNRKLMTDVASVKKLVKDIDEETNAVAAKVEAQAAALQALKDQVAAGNPVTQDDLDAIGTELGTVSDRLRAIGADPTNPIPPAA